MEYLHVQLETKQSDGLKIGQFDGYGSVFGNVDLGGDVVERGAFAETLAEHAAKGTMPSMFASHNPGQPIGEYLEMREDERGLYVKGQLWVEGVPDRAPVEAAAQYWNQMKSSAKCGLSIGYFAKECGYEKRDGEPVRLIKKTELIEVSPTTMPMNQMALTSAVKGLVSDSGRLLTTRELECSLRDAGFTQREAKATLKFLKDLVASRDAGNESTESAADVAALKAFNQRFKGG